MSSGKKDLFKSSYEEYSNTHERQQETQNLLTEKSVEVIKVNLLVGSIAASVVTLRPESVSMTYFIAGSFTLAASVYFNLKVYSPTTTYDIGIAGSAFDSMRGKSLQEHYKTLAKEYSEIVTEFGPKFKKELEEFDKGLWLAGATIFLYIAGTFSTFARTIEGIDYPLCADFAIIAVIGVSLWYARKTTKLEED